MLVDEFMPVYDVSDAVATVVEADVATTWNALMETNLLDVARKRPSVGILSAIRILPDVINALLRGKFAADRPSRMRLRDVADVPIEHGGWILLGNRNEDEIALGLIGKFWHPVIQFAPVATADEFRAFTAPGFARTIYALSVRPMDGGKTLLSAMMRTATTDEHARRWFRRYWTLGVGSGAHLLVNSLLEVTRETAELKASKASSPSGEERKRAPPGAPRHAGLR